MAGAGSFRRSSATPWGRFTVDPRTMRTNRTGVFAGGDDVNGADLVVTALADAHVAAASIEDWLGGGDW